MIVLNLFIINIIVVLAHESGFIEKMDEMINSKWRFYHLPYPVKCMLCSCWWISLLYIILTPGAFTLLNIMLCLINAHLTEITQGIWRITKQAILTFLGRINDLLTD